MKSLEKIKDESAWELGFINYIEFERKFNNKEIEFTDINNFLELYAKKRVKDVEEYYRREIEYLEESYKSHEYGE